MVKGTRYPPQVLSRAEVEALMRACGRSRTGLRNCALLVLLHRGGMRLGEALELRPAQVDWDAGDVRVLHGKGDEARTTSVGRAGLAVLREWHDARSELELPTDAPLICTLAGTKVKHQYVVTMLGRLAARACVEKRVHAHGLRHTFAHELNAEGARPTDIRDLLGHRSLATTDAYLRALGASQAVEFARSRGR